MSAATRWCYSISCGRHAMALDKQHCIYEFSADLLVYSTEPGVSVPTAVPPINHQ